MLNIILFYWQIMRKRIFLKLFSTRNTKWYAIFFNKFKCYERFAFKLISCEIIFKFNYFWIQLLLYKKPLYKTIAQLLKSLITDYSRLKRVAKFWFENKIKFLNKKHGNQKIGAGFECPLQQSRRFGIQCLKWDLREIYLLSVNTSFVTIQTLCIYVLLVSDRSGTIVAPSRHKTQIQDLPLYHQNLPHTHTISYYINSIQRVTFASIQ